MGHLGLKHSAAGFVEALNAATTDYKLRNLPGTPTTLAGDWSTSNPVASTSVDPITPAPASEGVLDRAGSLRRIPSSVGPLLNLESASEVQLGKPPVVEDEPKLEALDFHNKFSLLNNDEYI